MFSIILSDATDEQISEFANKIIAASAGVNKLQVELSSEPWMFLKSANGEFYFTKGDDATYQKNRLTYDKAVTTDGDVAMYDHLFVHLRDDDGTALVRPERVVNLLRNYKQTIECFGLGANPRMLRQVILIDEVEQQAAELYNNVCHYQNMAQSYNGLDGIHYQFMLGVAQSKLAAYNAVIEMMRQSGDYFVDRESFEAIFQAKRF